MLLGEARSKCEHLAGIPLSRSVADRFYRVALIKGAQATTAIEGNTLTEDQVAGILDGTFKAPPSRSYQEREVSNVLDALQEISEQITSGDTATITTELICEFNRRLLEGTDHNPEVVPGGVRKHEVMVANYRGAPAEDCNYLLERLAEWLQSGIFDSDDSNTKFALIVAKAVYAHLYIAWLHPFVDGNGHTARLLEFVILVDSGLVPLPAANLLANHYNLTRDRYYRELAAASRSSSARSFLSYAIEGLVDGLREQIHDVRKQQLEVTWINYVHETMSIYPSSAASNRQRKLVLAMRKDTAYTKSELQVLTAELAAAYATKGPRTLSRDLNRLKQVNLIGRHSGRWTANHKIVEAFLAPQAETEL